MNIGILTYHCVPNFGAQLQTLSTVCYLRNQGHEPIVLHWYPKDLEELYGWTPTAQIEAHNSFSSAYFPLSTLCRTEDELIGEIDKLQLDAILLGSDALFKYVPILRRVYLKMGKRRPHLVFEKVPSVERLQHNPFFGDFISKLNHSIPVSVYAVSSQNAPYTSMIRSEKLRMKEYMSNFKFISVRDTWTQKMVETITGDSQIAIYPDPVFAFNQNVGKHIPSKDDIIRKFDIDRDYVLLSFWTDNCSDEYIQSLADEVRKYGLQPIMLTMPEGLRYQGTEKAISIPLSPMDWFALIKYASGYIGERMHPIVVSLHNAVPCFAFDEYGASKLKKVIFPRIGKWDKDKSKTYYIMSAAGFENNWFAYGSNLPLPLPKVVVGKVLAFDKQRCLNFASQQYICYETGMQTVLNTFI